MRLVILLAVLVVFTTWSMTVVFSHGFFGFLTLSLREPWALQMLLDLGIALFIAWSFMKRDAEQRGINPWPYMLGTALLGSPVALAYLIHRELKKKSTPAVITT